MLSIDRHPFRLPDKTLALTFDDGPGPRTIEIAEFLYTRGIQATFFIVGRHARERPEVVPKLKAMGHSIGNHTDTHRNLARLTSPTEVVREVLDAHRVIQEFAGEQPTLLRSPWGDWSPAVAHVLNANAETQKYIGPVLWNIDHSDYGIGSHRHFSEQYPRYTLDECRENYRCGILARRSGVILLHDWSADVGRLGEHLRLNNRTLELIQWLVPHLAGFRFVGAAEIAIHQQETGRLQ